MLNELSRGYFKFVELGCVLELAYEVSLTVSLSPDFPFICYVNVFEYLGDQRGFRLLHPALGGLEA